MLLPGVSHLALLSAGFDLGTSGARISVVESASAAAAAAAPAKEVYYGQVKWRSGAHNDPREWIAAVESLLEDTPGELRGRISRLCISGTSASVVLAKRGEAQLSRSPALMYNDNVLSSPSLQYRAAAERAWLKLNEVAPESHTTLTGTSALMKLLTWSEMEPIRDDEVLCHQADFVSKYFLGGADPPTDWNNALKTGYDIGPCCWPEWLSQGLPQVRQALPDVVAPGALLAPVSSEIIRKFGLSNDCCIYGGTTDSIAAFIAAGCSEPGEAVTSLGSTLAIKMLSTVRVDDASRGVYSHRWYGDELWLIGGASNSGCTILREEGFSTEELRWLSEDINPQVPSPLGEIYNPLPGGGASGERFPRNDPEMRAILEPKPASRREYLHGILEVSSSPLVATSDVFSPPH
jgi:sugar (pentulose or hexulose) kinase